MATKGKRGEARIGEILSIIAQIEENFDYIRPIYTNPPDGGVDFEVKCSGNIYKKFDSIIQEKDKLLSLLPFDIKIRIDSKDYNNKIVKRMVENFIKACENENNISYTEHWLVGEYGLTKRAKKILNNMSFICRYYSQEDMNKIKKYYRSILDNLENKKDNTVEIEKEHSKDKKVENNKSNNRLVDKIFENREDKNISNVRKK